MDRNDVLEKVIGQLQSLTRLEVRPALEQESAGHREGRYHLSGTGVVAS